MGIIFKDRVSVRFCKRTWSKSHFLNIGAQKLFVDFLEEVDCFDVKKIEFLYVMAGVHALKVTFELKIVFHFVEVRS